ncbi:non-hydrolyzing UDP-N-acetylglucosamine 2-epimerase [Algoriphagus mannitolivorans]|uniref:non-hydrolyzing UDP-N-acetylglucosamine 2-epimerase n=1 Tax=Algoriphagus mannitolivorans TaxID=226504 RepID=UPI000420BD08|nr:UDP-N-acetylglucosamine 2-epimerase (non-hydrolyzing) [Algoriphagus mannitolivorans]
MKKEKILFVFGTRPEAIKLAPIIKGFLEREEFLTKVCLTSQHREMLDQVIDFFELPKDYDLNIMQPNQTLAGITSRIFTGLDPIMKDFQPDYVFVHGDTTTSMVASLSAFYAGAKVCHVEAGLRTNDKNSPFPEEMNRQITGRVATFHFTPTQVAKENLIKENIADSSIVVTGNSVIDALLFTAKKTVHLKNAEICEICSKVDLSKKVILVTGHRRENHGEGIIKICQALRRIALEIKGTEIVFPVHLNPNIASPVKKLLSDIPNIHLINPLSYPSFVWMMKQSKLILTDSGGVQEEAPSLGKPVLVLRENTERPEAVKEGTVILLGTDEDKIFFTTQALLTDSEMYHKMSIKNNPYGDGKTTERIIQFMLNASL